MSKKKQKKKMRAYTVSLPQVGLVTLSASRESCEPFCSWYGPHGEICSQREKLCMVATLPGTPPVGYMACPAHFDEVRESIEQFLARLGTSLEELKKVGK